MNKNHDQLAREREARGIVRAQYGSKLYHKDVEAIVQFPADIARNKPLQFKIFEVDKFVPVKDLLAKVMGCPNGKDVVLDFGGLPPLKVGEEIVIEDHTFRVRKLEASYAIIRPTFGRASSYF